MSAKRYGTVLTVIIVLVVLLTVFLIGKLIYDLWDKKKIRDAAEEIIAQFDKKIEDAQRESNDNINGINTTAIKTDLSNFTYGGYNMMGYIEIPKIKVKYPVLESVTTHSIEIAVAIRWGAGLNEIGRTVIVGHNYRNGLFFSDLGKLKVNDLVYITDRSGQKIKYKIFNIFSTYPEDTEYFNAEMEGTREIALATCSDTAKMRTVVLAREVTAEDENNNTNTNTTTTNNNQTTINTNITNTIENNTIEQIKINRTEIKKK